MLIKRAALVVFFTCFVAAGSWGLQSIRYNLRVTQPGALSSTDSQLAKALGISGGSAKVQACLGELRTERRVMVWMRKSSPAAALFGQAASVLGWPKKVWLFEVPDESAGGVLNEALAREPEALFCAGVPPPASFGHAIELGGGVVFVRSEATAP